jgi:hypothetical protein
MRLIIKGNRFQAAKAAADRGIGFAFIAERYDGRTIGEANLSATKANEWLCETGIAEVVPGLGYPVGSLLYWSEPSAK